MFSRHVKGLLALALNDSPVVLLVGPRQSGKTTLVRDLLSDQHSAQYFTLDDATSLNAVKSDPAGFVAGLTGPVILDEVQRAPEVLPAIKAAVDRNRRPGRFLLTGSANVLLLPSVSESLAGRMEIVTLWAASQGEIDAKKEAFVDTVFGTMPSLSAKGDTSRSILQRALRGGYPEVLARKDDERRRAWFASYVTSILQRDVRDLANIEKLHDLPRLLGLVAARAAGLQNFSELSRSSNIPQSTLKRYLALLEMVFLIETVRPWSGNLSHRLVKSPKMMLTDTGLLAYLTGLTLERLSLEDQLKGPLLENFVYMELRKQAAWSKTKPALFHYRTQTGQEVDIVMENASGKVVGIEVKAAATINSNDFKGLRALAEDAGAKFHRGIVLYCGETSIPFGKSLQAIPVSALWRITGSRSP